MRKIITPSAARWLVFMTAAIMLVLEILLPKLVILRWYELNMIEFLPNFYLGLGLGTLLSIFTPRAWLSRLIPTFLAFCIAFASLAILLADDLHLVKFATAIPFIPIGIILGQIFAAGDTHIIYALDLAGIALGVLVLSLGLGVIGGETLILVCIALPLIFAVRSASKLVMLSGLAAVLALAATPAILSPKLPIWDFYALRQKIANPTAEPGHYNFFSFDRKPQADQYAEIVGSKWDLVARTDIGKTHGSPLSQVLGPRYCYTGQCISNPHYQNETGYSFYYNGKWINAISPEYFLKTDFTLAHPGDKALVIGLGGGADLPTLIDRGVEAIDGAEINAAATQLIRQDFIRKQTGDAIAPVSILPLDGRAVVENALGTYDVIVLNGAELYIPMPYSRVYLESYLYTVEGFRDYYRSLTPNGVLHISKFGSYEARTNEEAYKLILTAMTALYSEGITEPEKHLQIVSIPLEISVHDTNQLIAVNVYKQPVDQPRYQEIFRNLHSPFVNVFSHLDPNFNASEAPNYLAAAIWRFGDSLRKNTTGDYFQEQGRHLIPATDDRPFFYIFDDVQTYNAESLKKVLRSSFLFIFLPILIIFAAAAFFTKKLALFTEVRVSPRDIPTLISLAATGFLFGMLQATVGQNFHIFLGSPVYSLLAIFCTFPALSAVASITSRNVGKRGVMIAIVLIAVCLALVQGYSSDFLRSLNVANGFLRIVIVALMLTPMAFAAGIPFPWLVAPYRQHDGRVISLLYAWNIGFMVIGTTCALVLASNYGFRATSQFMFLGYLLLAPVILFVSSVRFAKSPGQLNASELNA